MKITQADPDEIAEDLLSGVRWKPKKYSGELVNLILKRVFVKLHERSANGRRSFI